MIPMADWSVIDKLGVITVYQGVKVHSVDKKASSASSIDFASERNSGFHLLSMFEKSQLNTQPNIYSSSHSR